MQNALYIEISIVGVCLLLIILFTQRENIGSSTMQRQFNLLVYSTIVILVIDAACWLIDGTTFAYARIFNIVIETLYFFFNAFIPYLWAVYVEIALNKNQRQVSRRLRILAIPVALMSVFLLVNLQTNSIFVIDANNVYHRNPGFLAYGVVAYAYMGYASVRALVAARRASWSEEKRRYQALAYFVVLPSIGAAIQIFVFGVTLIWIFVAVSIMLMYIDSLNRQISTDPLTGINNRRELTKYLRRETRDPEYHGVLALIMMDVDGFKQFNDAYGHYYGDGVLIAVSEILKQSCKNTPAFLARYGGDEFCIVYPAEDVAAVDGIIAKIQANAVNCYSVRNEPVSIELSIGYAVWDPKIDKKVDDLYKRADEKMYQTKSLKKNA